MKKFVTKLMLMSTAALAMLGSCETPIDNSTSGNDASASTSVADKDPSKIKREKEIPFLQENIYLNLDNFITIEYSDGSTDKNYELSTNAKSITIDGHKVKGSEVGTFYITVTAGGLVTKLDVTVLSNDQIKMEAFLEPLLDDPQNFTIDVHYEDDNGQDQRLWTVLHNARYTVIYDPDDLYAVDDNGNPDNFILAKLSDGNGYQGSYTEGANHTPVPTFEPGILSQYDWYYVTMPIELDAADSTYISLDGDDILLMSPTFAESLMWSSGLSHPKSNGVELPYYGAAFAGFQDINIDGNPDIATFDIIVGDDTDNAVWCTLILEAIGSSELSWMNAAIADASYIPAKITSNEITTAFLAANTAGNFTLTLEAYAYDDDGNKIVPAEADVAGGAVANLFGSCDAVITEKYTSTGIYTEYKRKELSQTATGYSQAADYSLYDISAVWNDSGAAYSTRLADNADQTAKVLPARTAIAGTTDVFTLNEVKQMAANNVTAAACDAVNWTSKKTNGTKTIFTGDVGDDDRTNKGNLLFEQLLNMFGGPTYSVLNNVIDGGKGNLGTMWTEPQEFNGGDYHALSLYSKYTNFSVDSATGEIEITLSMYAPLGFDDGYFGMKMTLSDIGTTTFDFSTLAAANDNPGILA